MNKVSCLKLIWWIQSSHNSLRVNWVRKHLIRQGFIWSVKGTTSLGSWIWKKLLKYRDLAASFSKTEIQNGASSSFWFDNWSPLGRIFDITGPRGSRLLGIPIISTVEQVLASHNHRHHRLSLLNEIEEVISSQRQQGSANGNDVALWKHKADTFYRHSAPKRLGR